MNGNNSDIIEKFSASKISTLFNNYLLNKGIPGDKKKLADPLNAVTDANKRKKKTRDEKELVGRGNFSRMKTPHKNQCFGDSL